MEYSHFKEHTDRVVESCSRVIVGKEETVRLIFISFLCSGHVLLEDVPGTGKTMLLKAFARTVGSGFKRIQFTPDLLPSDLTGINFYNQKTGEFQFREGPLFTNIVLADEINRSPAKVQSALLEALQHLFNLRFHTEEETKTVRIEPADEFFGSGTTADWRDRSDFSQPVVLADIAPEIHESRTWGYQESDGAVNRFNAGAGSPFGEWSVRTDSYAAREGDQVLRNPLFRPTLSEAGHYANAPSAQIMQVGDRDDVQEDGTNFTPRIVRFAGLHPLPAGERWEYPSGLAEYPLAAFHFTGDAATEGFTLCFEDRDGVRGLHRYYDLQTGRESAGRRITLSLRLAPHEFESLFTPGTGMPDLRSVFRLDTGGEEIRATLHAIESYDPQAASARCTFTRLSEG